MAEHIRPASVKKAKRSSPVHKLKLKREPGISLMICMRMEEHSFVSAVSTVLTMFLWIHTLKDHLKSKKHCSRKKTKVGKGWRCMSGSATGSSRKITLSTLVKSKDVHQDFILDYVKLYTLVDIPLEKTEKIRPFLRKDSAQALPQIDQLHSTYVPRLFVDPLTALKDIPRGQLVSITADESIILNVIATFRSRPYFISVSRWMLAITGHLVKPSSSLSLV